MTHAGCTTATRRLSILVLSGLTWTGCAGQQHNAESGDAARRSSFEAATEAFHQALRTDNADAMFAYVADDVVLMPPGEPAVRGKSAMRQWYDGFLSQFRTSSLTLGNREVFVSDEWAVETGTYEWTLTPAAGGDPMVDHGNYMQVWKAQSDGAWQFEREIWNSSGSS